MAFVQLTNDHFSLFLTKFLGIVRPEKIRAVDKWRKANFRLDISFLDVTRICWCTGKNESDRSVANDWPCHYFFITFESSWPRTWRNVSSLASVLYLERNELGRTYWLDACAEISTGENAQGGARGKMHSNSHPALGRWSWRRTFRARGSSWLAMCSQLVPLTRLHGRACIFIRIHSHMFLSLKVLHARTMHRLSSWRVYEKFRSKLISLSIFNDLIRILNIVSFPNNLKLFCHLKKLLFYS